MTEGETNDDDDDDDDDDDEENDAEEKRAQRQASRGRAGDGGPGAEGATRACGRGGGGRGGGVTATGTDEQGPHGRGRTEGQPGEAEGTAGMRRRVRRVRKKYSQLFGKTAAVTVPHMLRIHHHWRGAHRCTRKRIKRRGK